MGILARTRGPLPPGPRTLRPSGMRNAVRGDVLGFYSGLARSWPGAASFRVYWFRIVHLSDPALIQALLRMGPEDVIQAVSMRGLRVVLGDGLLTATGDAWREERERVQPAFRHDRLRSYAPMMVERARRTAEGWVPGREVDLHRDVSRLTLDIVADALFGTRLSGDVRKVADSLARVMDRFEEVYIRSRFPIPLTAPTPPNLRLRRVVGRLHGVVDTLVARRMARAEDRDDLLTGLIAAARTEGTLAARRRLRDEVLTLLLAGHETTALAITYALWLLARHPAEEARLLRELDTVVGDRDPGAEDLPRLPHLRRVVQETLRLYPPAWGMGREAVRELELGGYHIPAGAQIFVLQWVTHRDPRYFRDPERFLPDRWLPDAPPGPDGTAAATREAYFPFGGGARACVGAGFALMEAPLVLAAILRRRRFEVPEEWSPELQPAVTLRPRGGVPAVVRER